MGRVNHIHVHPDIGSTKLAPRCSLVWTPSTTTSSTFLRPPAKVVLFRVAFAFHWFSEARSSHGPEGIIENCSSCVSSIRTCDECLPPLLLVSNATLSQCYPSCPPSYFPDPTQHFCYGSYGFRPFLVHLLSRSSGIPTSPLPLTAECPQFCTRCAPDLRYGVTLLQCSACEPHFGLLQGLCIRKRLPASPVLTVPPHPHCITSPFLFTMKSTVCSPPPPRLSLC
jgi:hypothetical protein